MIGRSLSHSEVSKSLGAGGMGEVYLARDTQLERPVALKILPASLAEDRDRMRRFVLEAKAASALSHPNVAHIYEIGEADGVHFIAMEYVEGVTLAERLRTAPRFPPAEVARIGSEIAATLEEAHAHGIIHRDLKPANIMMGPRERVKLLDFGVAKLALPAPQEAGTELETWARTELGTVLGTLPYMSPEQLRGAEVDPRTDFFSLGVVLFQLATGQMPFEGKTAIELADRIFHQPCPPLRQLDRRIPSALAAVVARLTAKEPGDRYRSAAEIVAALQPLLERPRTGPAQWRVGLRRAPVAVPAALVLTGLLAFLAWSSHRGSRSRWARDDALPRALELMDQARYPEAFALAEQAERYIPGNPILGRIWPNISRTLSIESDPAGAEVFIKPYRDVDADWRPVGRTPIRGLRVARDIFRVQVGKPGFDTALRVAPTSWFPDQVDLAAALNGAADAPPGMVRVPGGTAQLPGVSLAAATGELTPRSVGDFWLDRHEVSNREFKELVDAGGYRRPEYWRHPFVHDGRELSWQEAMEAFVDTTGKPGPAGWELGDFPAGKDDLPVTGVSWYEAAAYAEYVGKSLPTADHWLYAAGIGLSFEIVPLSNFGGQGPHPVGGERSLSPYGTFDMAGNVKEWVWNATGQGEHYLAGGGYGDPEYLFTELDRRPPFQREPTFGFRCARYIVPPASETLAPFDRTWRDFRKETPVPDDVFALVKSLYSYEKTDLRATLVSADDTDRYWRRERITFDAAYGGERVIVHLFLPKTSRPPYQTVVFFPGAWARDQLSSENIEHNIDFAVGLDFVIRSGRAAVYPVYAGTFERGGGPRPALSPAEFRDWTLHYIKDLRRTVDYLETRENLDVAKLAFYGYSWGARIGPIASAVEDRFRVLILAHGGLPSASRAPEVDEFNFLPRVTVPTLMINGRYDHVFPVEPSQKPFFDLLGTPAGDKAHLILEGGHSSPRQKLIKAVLGWLDRYLGPVAS
jgi:dienelactone hydrolase/predicted Ser/Thr protein kinase